uniref:Uncharacterized protein n=1 Tax=Phlebotomus papatasi TaxID=29031 RepID=A0A1B0DDS1_PHLPP
MIRKSMDTNKNWAVCGGVRESNVAGLQLYAYPATEIPSQLSKNKGNNREIVRERQGDQISPAFSKDL